MKLMKLDIQRFAADPDIPVQSNVTIHFTAGEGGSGTMDDVTFSGSYTLNTCNFTREGYKFACYKLIAATNYTERVDYYALGDSIVAGPDAEVTLEAQWRKDLTNTTLVTNGKYYSEIADSVREYMAKRKYDESYLIKDFTPEQLVTELTRILKYY